MDGKIFFCSLIFCLLCLCGKVFASDIDSVIKANPQFSQAIVAISVKDANNGNVLYQKNPKILVHPASALKIITSAPAYDYLGSNYEFKTAIYKNSDKVYFKVGADPLFTYADMRNLVAQYKTKNTDIIRKFIIDDFIIDDVPYGIGWQWDDNANVHFPQMSPYIINRNLFMLKAKVNDRGIISIEKAKEYSEPIISNVVFGDVTNVIAYRDIFQYNPPVTLKGEISENAMIYIPAINPALMYKNMLMYSFLDANIPFNSKFQYAKVPRFSTLEASISHNILDVLHKINANSDNLAAEILLKHLASVKYEKTGTTKDGLEMIKDFYSQNGVDLSNINLVDASGVSMNDYVSAEFMVDALRVIKNLQTFNDIKISMANSQYGTFNGRLTHLKNKLYVKTGTLANTSSVVGYLKANSGRDLVFAIILDNLPQNINAKEFENEIITAISQF